jgi:hypothetical protein
MASATVALPLLLAVYIMKAALQESGATGKRTPERYRSAAAWAFTIAYVAIAVSLSAIGAHEYGRLAGQGIGAALAASVGAALKVDGKFGGEPNQQQWFLETDSDKRKVSFPKPNGKAATRPTRQAQSMN